MPRHEFTREIRRAALRRADRKCEASGRRYGLAEGYRCYGDITKAVIFDHDVPDQLGGDNSLSNCRAICTTCNKAKTAGDITQIRKSDRQRDKATGAYPKGQSFHRPAGIKFNWAKGRYER